LRSVFKGLNEPRKAQGAQATVGDRDEVFAVKGRCQRKSLKSILRGFPCSLWSKKSRPLRGEYGPRRRSL